LANSISQVRTLKPPEEDIGFPHGFMYLRLSDLRGGGRRGWRVAGDG